MKNKFVACVIAACLATGLTVPLTVYADGEKVVTLGADLSEEQRTAILRYFGVYGSSIRTIEINNQDERDHLGAYIPLEQIGTRTYSCALVKPTTSGGIQVKTANLTYVTSNMIASTLSTSGVVNCEVLAASPFEVSGTGALTGILMAYETASGQSLNAEKKEIATQELITTGQIADTVGQAQATNIVNEIKIQVIEGQVTDQYQIADIVNTVVDENSEVQAAISDEQLAMLQDLAMQISEQQYNYEEMQETLQRVEENVAAIVENQSYGDDDAISEDEEEYEIDEAELAQQEEEEEEPDEPEELPEDSILLQTDDSALGENVIIDATTQEAVAAEYQENADPEPEEAGFVTTISDEASIEYTEQPEAAPEEYIAEESVEEQPAQEAPAEEYVEEQPAQEAPAEEYVEEQPEAAPEEYTAEEYVEEQPAQEAPAEEYVEEQPEAAPEEYIAEEPVEEQPAQEAPAEEYAEEQPAEEIPDEEYVEEQPAEDIPALVLGDCSIASAQTSDSSSAAGTSVIALYVNTANITPVGGYLVATDDFGAETARADLSQAQNTAVTPMSDNDLMEKGWSEGTVVLVNLGTSLQQYMNYTVYLEGAVFASTDNPEIQGTLEKSTTLSCNNSFGIALHLYDINSLKVGGSINADIVSDGSAVSAAITSFSSDLFDLDALEFDLQNGQTNFNLYTNQSGKGYISIALYNDLGEMITEITENVFILS